MKRLLFRLGTRQAVIVVAVVAAAALGAVGAVGWLRWTSSGAQTISVTARQDAADQGRTTMVPVMDLEQPEGYETATFALG